MRPLLAILPLDLPGQLLELQPLCLRRLWERFKPRSSCFTAAPALCLCYDVLSIPRSPVRQSRPTFRANCSLIGPFGRRWLFPHPLPRRPLFLASDALPSAGVQSASCATQHQQVVVGDSVKEPRLTERSVHKELKPRSACPPAPFASLSLSLLNFLVCLPSSPAVYGLHSMEVAAVRMSTFSATFEDISDTFLSTRVYMAKCSSLRRLLICNCACCAAWLS